MSISARFSSSLSNRHGSAKKGDTPAHDLSALVNIAGRQRMLSQRIILYATLSIERDSSFRDQGAAALEEFKASHLDLTQGEHCMHLKMYWGSKPQLHEMIGQFIDCAERIFERTYSGAASISSRSDVESLQDGGDPVLKVLHECTQFCEGIARAASEKRRSERKELMENIGRIAREAKVISMNARIIAARAQDHGKEFAVVAGVLASVTERIELMVREGQER